MNKNNDWIKMGFNICKILIISIIVIAGLWYSNSAIKRNQVEKFSFNKSFGVNANIEKKEEETPVEEPKVEEKTKYIKGTLTAYVADCPKCTGKLACKGSYDVLKNNVDTYVDKEYGEVRIVASSKKLACGSIVRFNLSSLSKEPITAIVLDRGVKGNNLDILMKTVSEAKSKVGKKNIEYEILRVGW